MWLEITETNFSANYEWLYKLKDEFDNVYYVMDLRFYKLHNLKNPVTKKELDSFHHGISVNASVQEIDGKNIVVAF